MAGVNVIDVHSVGSRRSDPEDGDSSDYPEWSGRTPQGDVQRGFNYIGYVESDGGNGSRASVETSTDDAKR